ncbi:hypothetical protein E4U55_002105 [Claviceps digitariae]|nr:hypothetical protein E4U55_002105 [Claviceps digitariae]
MSSSIPMDYVHAPFPRTITHLYNDTKKSSDFVKESSQNAKDPDMKSLHRQLCIQKDRLASWGLEWSDSNQCVEIDESISKAGLSLLVASTMRKIKHTLAATEPLWQSSMHPSTSKSQPPGDLKVPLVQRDKGRFENLIRDLTESIDTLYDLSRTQPSSTRLAYPVHENLLRTKAAYKPSSSSLSVADEYRSFESSRVQTPPPINPQTLIHLRPKQQGDAEIPHREVVSMLQEAYSELTQNITSKQPWEPLLLEYAPFNPIFSATGVMPPMSPLEKLFLGLQQDSQCAPGAWTGLPRLLGYFLDLENSRIGLIYSFPSFFNHVLYDHPSNTSYSFPTLSDLLQCHKEPTLEAKFSLAYGLANTVFEMHARGLTHGNFSDRNVLFCESECGSKNSSSSVDIRHPLISSFELFPEERSASKVIPWLRASDHHGPDPRLMAIGNADERVLELYPLAMVLLSIGMWVKVDSTKIEDTSLGPIIPEPRMSEMATKCGTLYTGAVQACLEAVNVGLTVTAHGERILSAVQTKVRQFLKTCCILDDVSGLEHGLAQELGTIPPKFTGQDRSVSKKDTRSSSTDIKSPLPAFDAPASPNPLFSLDAIEKAIIEAKPLKMRLYPHVQIAPEVVDKWNTILMPQVNQALRHFYRTHPESVEVSLESVGPSAHATKPTVVVVCSSVRKVRSILETRLGELFDGTTGFALKVCRGHVVQSRRYSKYGLRSVAHSRDSAFYCHVNAGAEDDEFEAVNPEYQECPGNGASIGAWIGDRHLPPVSFGGLVLVDDKPYGLTVHHMLDDPDQEAAQMGALRSTSAPQPGYDWYADLRKSGTDDEEFSFDLSDTESEAYFETDMTSEYGWYDDDDDEDQQEEEEWDKGEPGDIPGIEPGCGDGYIVTQPALDDVEEGFYPCAETEDEDHLHTFSLGKVYASSGIRRKRANGLVHEVDWALFEFQDGRLPEDNLMPRWEAEPSSCKAKSKLCHDLHKLRPTTVAPSSSLPGLEVQCIARTSGLQTGRISAALTTVKIYGRCSPSHTYQVASTPSSNARTSMSSDLPLGVPGDSGAWVVDLHQGQLCGHVLAWSQRKRVAYICPMDIVLLDMAQTLAASEVRLPGGGPVVTLRDSSHDLQEAGYLASTVGDSDDEVAEDMLVGKNGATSECATVAQGTKRADTEAFSTNRITSKQEPSTPTRFETSTELRGLAARLEDLNIGSAPRIGVSG